jgi:hypothetical protein
MSTFINLPDDILRKIAKMCISDNALTNTRLVVNLTMSSKSLEPFVQFVVNEVDPPKDDDVICNTEKLYDLTKKQLQCLCKSNDISYSIFTPTKTLRFELSAMKSRDKHLKLTGKYMKRAHHIKLAGYTANKRLLDSILNR